LVVSLLKKPNDLGILDDMIEAYSNDRSYKMGDTTHPAIFPKRRINSNA
jgi:hypothetical protein